VDVGEDGDAHISIEPHRASAPRALPPPAEPPLATLLRDTPGVSHHKVANELRGEAAGASIGSPAWLR
jgi:hypothetical protein